MYVIRAARLATIPLSLLLALGCEEKAPEPVGEFELEYMGATWTGADVDCKVNTSSPDGDPAAGKFFVRAGNADTNAFYMLLHFLTLDASPPAGDYDLATQLDLNIGFTGESGDSIYSEPTVGSVAVEDEGSGYRVTLDVEADATVTGSVLCPQR